MVEFNGEAYLHNGSLKDHATATALGLVHGGFGVVQNHVGGIAGNNTIVNNTVGKFIFNTATQGGLYVGSEVSKGALRARPLNCREKLIRLKVISIFNINEWKAPRSILKMLAPRQPH